MARLSSKDERFLEANAIFLSDKGKAEPPIYDYLTDDRISSQIANKLDKLGMPTPTPIQAVSIPLVLKGRDVIGISETGSGKTMCFLLPAFTMLLKAGTNEDSGDEFKCRPQVVVIVPTRELAIQIEREAQRFGLFESVCLYGGSPKGAQCAAIRSFKPPIIVGTPGRMTDIIDNTELLDMNHVKMLVLDEADAMLDMGFHPQIMRIIDTIPSREQRQTLMFSATWQRSVKELASELIKTDHVSISIGSPKLKACPNIKQCFMICERDNNKRSLLCELLKQFAGYKILVFANSKVRVQELCEFTNVQLPELNLTYIHGDVPQPSRTRIIDDFNADSLLIVFATDVASRGLDFKKINIVINFDFPNDVETYVHRIGRSGRRNMKSMSFSFITPKFFENPRDYNRLLSVVEESSNEIPQNLVEAYQNYCGY